MKMMKSQSPHPDAHTTSYFPLATLREYAKGKEENVDGMKITQTQSFLEL